VLDKVDARGEDKLGVRLLKRALTEPLRQLAINAGLDGSVVLNKVLEGKDDFGFNAATEQYENLMAAGVIDPTKVVRFALQNAASVAGLMLTTEAMITDKPEKKKKEAMPSPKTWMICIDRGLGRLLLTGCNEKARSVWNGLF
jgi:chaperonin GroEL